MADGEFIGPGGIVRQTIIDQGQWGSAGIKNEPMVVATSSQSGFYPATAHYEWKVEEPTQMQVVKKGAKHRPVTGNATANNSVVIPSSSAGNGVLSQTQPATITVSVSDLKSIPQAIIAQCSNAWSTNNSAVTVPIAGTYFRFAIYVNTVWKIHDFAITHILREINFGD